MVHCKAGADRSGLAAVFWKMVVDGAPKPVVLQQLSICFGHIPFGPTQARDRLLEKWVISTKERGAAVEVTGELFNRSEYASY